ncbi:hypothetical protein C8Q75DRAFT_249442 [Abortiporus biennis]|nr:hypothetical protein C8Q75DRAFT_249442 [Abortiporus biennis]
MIAILIVSLYRRGYLSLIFSIVLVSLSQPAVRTWYAMRGVRFPAFIHNTNRFTFSDPVKANFSSFFESSASQPTLTGTLVHVSATMRRMH